MASAAVGGSHLIASTQAGALYGWQLALIIILTNLFKYPFFRFSAHYTLDTGKSLIEGYAEKSCVYLWVFLILCIASATINAGAVAIVTAAIVKMAAPSLMFDAGTVAALIMASCLIIVVSGRYRALDRVSKIIIVTLSIATLAAAGIAMSRGMQMQPDFIEPTPWTLAGLGFLIALMGWMPAPIEISAINSLWVTEKQRIRPFRLPRRHFRFQRRLYRQCGFGFGFPCTGRVCAIRQRRSSADGGRQIYRAID